MQFGIFTVGDVTTDPTTGRTPTEAERIKELAHGYPDLQEYFVDVLATGIGGRTRVGRGCGVPGVRAGGARERGPWRPSLGRC